MSNEKKNPIKRRKLQKSAVYPQYRHFGGIINKQTQCRVVVVTNLIKLVGKKLTRIVGEYLIQEFVLNFNI